MTARALALVIALVGACATVSLEQATRDAATTNQRAHDDAATRASIDGVQFTPYAAPIRPTDGTEPLRSSGIALPGLADGEELLIMPDGTLAFTTVDCVVGDACGCEVASEYRFVRRPDRSVVVIRLRPKVHVRALRVLSCGTGCGQPAPVIEPTAHALGVRRADQLTIVDAGYPYELVRETCDHPIPRP